MENGTNSPSAQSVHMIVRGKVQGVGFRFHVRDQAEALGIVGWVRNLPDGSVEIYAEGGDVTLAEFVERVEEGPRFSHVADVEKEYGEPAGDATEFTIEF